ncbi:hypothetical protein SLS56_002135 [Neofusicoccum ribis]|uniref:BTB domain-containing protein n=1 Tax=Neofusicoccum ribis TaxID=45134 RepID=A0ABR3T579_9PEZI
MSQEFEHVVLVKVGPEEEAFSVHAHLMATHMFYFARILQTTPTVGTWSLPTIQPRAFHLLLDYIYGGPMTLSWAKSQDRKQLVDAWVLGDMVGATRFTNTIIRTIATNATRPGPRKILPDNACIAHAYDPDTTEKDAPIRRLFVDLYIHFGTPDNLNELLAGPCNLRSFWFDYCDRSRDKDEHDDLARKLGDHLRLFDPNAYFIDDPRLATPEPIPVTRAGTKPYLCHYDGVNEIVVQDGQHSVFIHRELCELRQDILLKRPPREIHFADGWRDALVIFMKWLYFGGVSQDVQNPAKEASDSKTSHFRCHSLEDFIRAYSIGETFHNPQFLDDLLTGIISYCTRHRLLPSALEIALTYETTSTGSPLRSFMVSWTLTHHHANPIDPNSLFLPPSLRSTFAADLASEAAVRTAAMNADMAESATHFSYNYTHPRLCADEMFAGDGALGGSASSAPYYGDDLCRFHVAHPYTGYTTPLANADADINGGIARLTVPPTDTAAQLLGFSTRARSSPATSSAAAGFANPASDVGSGVARNPCHALLRRRNCYGTIILGYVPAATTPTPVSPHSPPHPAIPRLDPAVAALSGSGGGGGTATSTPYVSPTELRFARAFPAPLPDRRVEPAAETAGAFNALRLAGGWQQRRCVDGRAYFVRFVPGGERRATWVDPREGVVWRRSDEVRVLGFEEGSETERDEESVPDTDSDRFGGGGEESEGEGGGDEVLEGGAEIGENDGDEKMVDAE